MLALVNNFIVNGSSTPWSLEYLSGIQVKSFGYFSSLQDAKSVLVNICKCLGTKIIQSTLETGSTYICTQPSKATISFPYIFGLGPSQI
jgi:hypothetical protein